MESLRSLPRDFQISYLQHGDYPLNIIHKTVSTYSSALQEYKSKLDHAADDLCEKDVDQVDVTIRDLKANDGAGADLDKPRPRIQSPQRLTSWLGVTVDQDPSDPSKSVVSVRKKDPKCRFIYIYGSNSRARLKVTRSMLEEILTFHQVMPDYLEFMFVFGLQSQPRDLGFSSFREQSSIKDIHTALGIENLGRSGRHYQLCYNLKGVTLKSQDRDHPIRYEWSIRQAAFYHRFDVVGGNTVWIVTKGGEDLDTRFKELTGKNAQSEYKSFDSTEACFRSSLSAHLLWCHWSREDWRGYIKWLEYVVDDETRMAVLGPNERGDHHRVYTTADVQRLLTQEEKISGAITVLESNIEVMSSLSKFYCRLGNNRDFTPANLCHEDIDVFTNELDNIMNDFKLQVSRATALIKLIRGRTEIVKQHRLERLNRHMENEAIVVRIITIVTLIYLPATFTSSFFSTDVVKYQDEGPNGSFSMIAMNRWLQVTLPLTFATLLLAFLALKWAERKTQTDTSISLLGRWRDLVPSLQNQNDRSWDGYIPSSNRRTCLYSPQSWKLMVPASNKCTWFQAKRQPSDSMSLPLYNQTRSRCVGS